MGILKVVFHKLGRILFLKGFLLWNKVVIFTFQSVDLDLDKFGLWSFFFRFGSNFFQFYLDLFEEQFVFSAGIVLIDT